MRRKMLQILLSFIFLFFSFQPTYAFDSKGHKAIERKADTLLEKYVGNGITGIQIIKFLKDSSFFAWDYPIPHSHFPDLSLERQFAQNRQMYHFMASNSDVMSATKENGTPSQQERLLVNSLQPCLKMMYFFFMEMIESPFGASQAGRGMYVLMHIVGDSYSPEHATRYADTGQLITIKGWQLSRLFWPPEATAKQEDNTLRMLHCGFNAAGDKRWKKNEQEDLSYIGEKAAEAIKALEIKAYYAKQNPEKADSLIRAFFEEYFSPLNSVISENSFVLSKGNVQYSFWNEFNHDHDSFVFKYDRSPQYSTMVSIQSGFSHKQAVSAYGIEFIKYIGPGKADDQKTILRRIPLGGGISLNKINADFPDNSFISGLRIKGFASAILALPLLKASLDPSIGLAAYPFSKTNFFSVIFGGDLVWNIGKDWAFPHTKATQTCRLSLGYSYDRCGFFSKNTIKLKLGVNTWHGRIITHDKNN